MILCSSHDKLVNAPVGVEAREKNRIAMARIYAENCGMLGATPHQVYGEFDQERCARRRRRREQERQLSTRCSLGTNELDEPGIDADMLVPLQGQHVWAV